MRGKASGSDLGVPPDMHKKADAVLASEQDATDDFATDFIASNLRVDVRRGHVVLMGHSVMLFRFEFLVALQKQLETTIGASAKGVLYLAGERAAEEVLPAMSERLRDLPPGRESLIALRRMSDTWATIGVGRATIAEFDPTNGRFVMRIEHGTFPAAYGPSTKPVCHLWAGWAAGVAKRLFGQGSLCEETACLAAGADACEFLITPP